MTGTVITAPIRIGVLGAARIADRAIVRPARVTGHRLVAVAARTRTEQLGRRSSYTYQLEAFAAHLRDGAPLPTDADDAVANMQLIDDCYRAAGLTPRPAGQPLSVPSAHENSRGAT